MIPVAKPYFDKNELAYVHEAVSSSWISSKGVFLERFAKMFADFCGVRYASTASNGTTALHLALLALDIKPGDEVLVPDFTFAATANVVLYMNAKPVLVDVERDTGCMSAEAIAEKITPRTKAIIPVHLYGHMCKMDDIMELASKHGLFVIEDAAESHGAECNGKKAGSFGHIGCFSFYGNKIITTGEGGMCVTNDKALHERMELLKNHGMSVQRRYWHDVVGYNYRMTNVQAAIGVAQMEKIDFFIRDKIRIAHSYSNHLSELEKEGVLQLPVCRPWAKCVYWLYNIVLKDSEVPRDTLMESLSGKGIETRPFFHPLHRMPPYQSAGSFPESEHLADNGLSLPSYVGLEEKDIEFICSCIKKELAPEKNLQ